ncbi:MAG: DUF3179 domain-containing protein [Cyclobacteriaceae bacterium]|nr:DUF3179 domain-containing protein [Cyclobacteriaceae bacterium HetDA_MAG_MS6]
MKNITAVMIIVLLSGCFEEPDGVGQSRAVQGTASDWLVPVGQVFDGGPGKDGIPALENPEMVASSDSKTDFIREEAFVVGIKIGNKTKAYAHAILDWHEIANDQIDDVLYAITYCPLTGSAVAWNRKINNRETTFGVSGLLYNSNLIPYDRLTDSNWSQMRQESINGSLIGQVPENVQIVETRWSTWKQMYPNTVVTSENTGHNRNYLVYPYGSYRSDDNVIFPVDNLDSRLNLKERVLGVNIDDDSKVYRFQNFSPRLVLCDSVSGRPILVVGDQQDGFIVAFHSDDIVSSKFPFTGIDNGSEVVMQDNTGNQYNLFGEVISGQGSDLEAVSDSYIAYWFAWAAFHDNTEIFTSQN